MKTITNNPVMGNEKKTSNFTRLIAVSFGHFINDFYMNLIPPILFLFATSLSLNLTQQGFVAFVITSSGSFAQPIIGSIVDKYGKTYFLILSIIWIGIWMSLTGIVTNYYVFVIVVFMGALASSLYHPLGSATATMLGNKTRGKSISLFMTIGGLAASVTPLITIPIVENYGVDKLVYFMIIAFISAWIMYALQIHKIEIPAKVDKRKDLDKKIDKTKLKWISIMVFVATNKVFIVRSFLTFGIQILVLKNIDIKIAGIILSAYLFLNVAGTIAGGFLNDTFGSKRVIQISNVIAVFVVLLIVFSPKFLAVIAFIFLGFVFNCTNAANIVYTQDLMPDNINTGTGLIMGLSGGIGGLGIFIFGKLGDHFGLISAAAFVLIPLIMVNILILFLPKKYKNMGE
ncbi:MFS transporter [Clostridium sp. DL1XJH146]